MKVLFHTFLFITLTGFLQSVWADDFEDMLSKEGKRWEQSLGVYKHAIGKFVEEKDKAKEADTNSAIALDHFKKADQWVQEIFLGVTNWIFQNGSWGMVEHAKILASPLK